MNLEKAISLEPSFKEYAKFESDFDFIKNFEEFKILTEK